MNESGSDVPDFVPAGLYGEVPNPQPTKAPRMLALVNARRLTGTGLTHEVTGLLKHNPMRSFTLKAILACVRAGALAGEVNSILHKLVERNQVVKTRRQNDQPTPHSRGYKPGRWAIVNSYKWRLPSDG